MTMVESCGKSQSGRDHKTSGFRHKAYVYIESHEKSDLLRRRVDMAQRWLPDGCDIVLGQTLDEASKLIHTYSYDIFITDSDNYYKLICDLPTFKVKIEEDFFSNHSDPLLDTKPLYYLPNKNALFIRERSAHNSRFLYEILRLVITPPLVFIDYSELKHESLHNYFLAFKNTLKVIFPYLEERSELRLSNENYSIKNSKITNHISIIVTSLPAIDHHVGKSLVNVKICNHIEDLKQNLMTDLKENISMASNDVDKGCRELSLDLSNAHDVVNILWRLNSYLECNGFISLYNNKNEISVAYANVSTDHEKTFLVGWGES